MLVSASVILGSCLPKSSTRVCRSPRSRRRSSSRPRTSLFPRALHSGRAATDIHREGGWPERSLGSQPVLITDLEDWPLVEVVAGYRSQKDRVRLPPAQRS